VVDARSGDFLDDTSQVLAGLRGLGPRHRGALPRRARRHPHPPLLGDAPAHPLLGNDIRGGLQAERKRLANLRQEATTVIDTGDLTVHGLRGMVLERYGRADGNLAVSMLSFGFKYGLPAEADIVLDVRFLPNPFFVETLSPLSGEDEAVRRFVLENPETQLFLSKADELLTLCIAAFEREGSPTPRWPWVHGGPPPVGGHRQRAGAAARERVQRSVRHRDIQQGQAGRAVTSCPAKVIE
jgi:UPF0042 nucleotide-binding protein